MLSKKSIDRLIDGNAGVHGRDLIIEIIVLGEGVDGRHCGWLSFSLGKAELCPEQEKIRKR